MISCSANVTRYSIIWWQLVHFCSPLEFTWCRACRINFRVNIWWKFQFHFLYNCLYFSFCSTCWIFSLLNWLVLHNVKIFSRHALGFIITIPLTVCSYHVTYVFQSESIRYSCLNVKELPAWNRHEIWSLSDCNWTQTHNPLLRKRTLNHLAKLA